MGTTYHIKMRINTALAMSDSELSQMFDGNPKLIRKELEDNKANGEVYIPTEGCEGFCPINGCPGHRKD